MKHAKPETTLERADRLITELADDGERNGQHRTDYNYLKITPDVTGFFSIELPPMPAGVHTLVKVNPPIGCDPCRQDLWDRNMAAIRWEIDNPLFAKEYK